MISHNTEDTRTDTDVLDSVEQVMNDSIANGQSRRSLMAKAGGLLAAGGALTLPGAAPASAATSRASVLNLLATFETFGVTLLSEAARRAPGTPSDQFTPVVKAANTTEYHHLKALNAIGGKTMATRFWIPDAVFDGNAGVFAAVAIQEEVEISTYLLAVTNATRRRNVKEARLYAEALGTEAEHRVLARDAVRVLTDQKTIVPNNRGFEAFKQKSVASAVRATEAAGIGVGKKGSKPGRFYTFGGDPRKNGTGSTVLTPNPS